MKISLRIVKMWIVSGLCSCSTCLWQLWEGISGFANSYLLCRIPWCSAKLGDLLWLKWLLKASTTWEKKKKSNHWTVGIWQVQSLGMLIFHKKTWTIQYSDVLRQILGGFVIPVKASKYWNLGHFIAILCWMCCSHEELLLFLYFFLYRHFGWWERDVFPCGMGCMQLISTPTKCDVLFFFFNQTPHILSINNICLKNCGCHWKPWLAS